MTFKLDQFFLYLTLISVIFNFSPLAAQNTDMSPTPLTPQLDITPPENIKSANEKFIPIIIPPSSKTRTPIKINEVELEKIDVSSRGYESSLSNGIYIIKRGEFEEYFKKKFPNKNIPKLTNSVYYK